MPIFFLRFIFRMSFKYNFFTASFLYKILITAIEQPLVIFTHKITLFYYLNGYMHKMYRITRDLRDRRIFMSMHQEMNVCS